MPFIGFSPETLDFFTELATNNKKPWFETHRSDYENYTLERSRNFVVALGDQMSELGELAPNMIADPRVNKSIFLIYHDSHHSKYGTQFH